MGCCCSYSPDFIPIPKQNSGDIEESNRITLQFYLKIQDYLRQKTNDELIAGPYSHYSLSTEHPGAPFRHTLFLFKSLGSSGSSGLSGLSGNGLLKERCYATGIEREFDHKYFMSGSFDKLISLDKIHYFDYKISDETGLLVHIDVVHHCCHMKSVYYLPNYSCTE